MKKRRGCLTAIAVVIFVIFVVAIIAGNSNNTPAPSNASSSEKPSSNEQSSSNNSEQPSTKGPVFIGNRGQVAGRAMGCPELDDLKAFTSAYAHAQVVKDKVGEGEAISTALQAGCMGFSSGTQGLVIDASGFLEGYTRMRMDSDQNAYWLTREAVIPIPGQPNKP